MGAAATIRAGSGEVRSTQRGAPEFFGVLPLVAVGLFALNNGLLKHAWPGWVTGKLSDFTACFFLPLFLSAVLERISPWRAAARMAAGIAATATIFIAVKTSPDASRLLDRGIASLLSPLGPIGARTAPNRVDPTDLCALPMLALAWVHARRRAEAPR